ncbi:MULTISPECIES: sulfatase-like hydrolase/transferase [unclassified Ruegeria]|uniref:sulfatase-like hydrolase/transferase n=1 Tax=unclassified Ruegeria TaxID=2625375 RepID=UPI0014930630|nr:MULTISPECIES: sulfatase-like hydrolase/transferase [unclassified Ruegeria]NOD49880.1 sulfatase-like hydrolase/transferase [Ruegeria sp. HKCCD5849]NOD54149.1 sulfatase-like hydrolase/transferase [Ruegeria sp. HKCCD5851]NOD68922.1 sulfatase-like hydrolase/transferase [Ruegeria sp. HKCCD7303]
MIFKRNVNQWSRTALRSSAALTVGAAMAFPTVAQEAAGEIVHDAEFYVLEAQNGARWAAEDEQLKARLAELEQRFGTKPNLIHIMWDDTAYGDLGIPAIQAVRGLDTPNINALAEEGMMFTRMYTEVGCTPSRAAAATGRMAIRSGMYNIGMLQESHGLHADEVTMAEVLGDAGYKTAFYGKWHLGDIEQSYPHNQGFDEALFTGYNQILSLNTREAEQGNASIGLFEDMLVENPYKLDDTFVTKDWVMVAEGTKGGETLQWRDNTTETYEMIDAEGLDRMFAFMESSVEDGEPFYVANWPIMANFMPIRRKCTRARALLQNGLQCTVDPMIADIRSKLEELGIAENTLIVAMADNGPMSHNPPPGTGFAETIFRGGKGDFLEGGVRVPAFAVWPGMIEPGSLPGDMIHITDLFTTFASLGGAMDNIPTDRVIDGLDQTSLLLNGDGHSRRDYTFTYAGPMLGAIVKGDYKRHFISPDPVGDASGIPAAFYFLPSDPREVQPMLTNLIHLKRPFNRMRLRHDLWKERYPDRPETHGIPWTGISNASEQLKREQDPQLVLGDLPFDPLEYIEHLDELPFDPAGDPNLGE